MDRKIDQPGWKRWGGWVFGVAILAAIVTAFRFSQSQAQGHQQNVASAGLDIVTVRQGVFEDTLAVRGRVMPRTTIFLDSVSGGVVQQRLVEHGDFVEQGQPLLRLENTALQLEVMSREAQVTEQLNFLRNTQMTMETNRLNLKHDQLETELQIRHIKRRLAQLRDLVEQGHVAQDDYIALKEDLSYFQARRRLTLEQQNQENSIRAQQVTQLQDSAKMLENNLAFARRNLDDLLVKAPVSGYLSELNAQVGESKEQGARLGQIDVPGEFKLVVLLDEFYLNQVTQGMAVRVMTESGIVSTYIARIDNRVVQNQFEIEVALPSNLAGVRRGQGLNAQLVLGDDQRDTLLLARGPFFSTSGGNWVFVLNQSGDRAERRAIRLGKRNDNVFEVIRGLAKGERVIVSAYSLFDKADSLRIN